jgi:hypothetical protein
MDRRYVRFTDSVDSRDQNQFNDRVLDPRKALFAEKIWELTHRFLLDNSAVILLHSNWNELERDERISEVSKQQVSENALTVIRLLNSENLYVTCFTRTEKELGDTLTQQDRMMEGLYYKLFLYQYDTESLTSFSTLVKLLADSQQNVEIQTDFHQKRRILIMKFFENELVEYMKQLLNQLTLSTHEQVIQLAFDMDQLAQSGYASLFSENVMEKLESICEFYTDRSNVFTAELRAVKKIIHSIQTLHYV